MSGPARIVATDERLALWRAFRVRIFEFAIRPFVPFGRKTTGAATSSRPAAPEQPLPAAETVEAFWSAIERLAMAAHAAGAANERARIAAIMDHPSASGRHRLAWAYASEESISFEFAVRALERNAIEDAFIAAAEGGQPLTLQ